MTTQTIGQQMGEDDDVSAHYQRSATSKHEGHNPSDPRVAVIEDLAQVMCSGCSAGEHRWRAHDCDSEWSHLDRYDPYEGQECEASAMLTAAVALGIPIYTGAELEFETTESN